MINWKVIAVDFDGTLCESKWPDIGEEHRELIEWLVRRQAEGARIVLWTCREGEMLDRAVMWCMNRGLKFDAINDNTKERIAQYGNNCRKVSADIYIDDRNAWIVGAGPKPRMDCLGAGVPAVVAMPEKFDILHKWKWQRESWKLMKVYQAEHLRRADERNRTKVKEETSMGYETAEWNVFNLGTKLEFAECSECGHEQEKGTTANPDDQGAALSPDAYPAVCPGCGAKMVDVVLADLPEGEG